MPDAPLRAHGTPPRERRHLHGSDAGQNEGEDDQQLDQAHVS
jgi:hypothetical protein